MPIKHEAIKLLASDTRLSILKLLDQRRMTVSELSRQLSLNKSTVHEHLGKLVEGGLIKRDESEEREWVYYELTKTAKYVLQPASARFVLLMGTAIAAGFVFVAFALVALNSGHGLAMQVEDTLVPAGQANVWDVSVTRPGFLGFAEPADQASLFLLSPEEAAEYQRTGALPQDAQPLGAGVDLVQDRPGQYRFRAALEPGTHYLLARSPAGAADALLPLKAQPVEVTPRAPSLLLGVDSPQVEVAVDFAGEPLDGGLVQAVDEAGRELAQVPVLNGKAVLTLPDPADEVFFRVQPSGPGSAFADAAGSLKSAPPHVAFTPAQVPLLVPTPLRVVVDDPGQGPREGAAVSLVRADDGRTVASGLTRRDGAAELDLRLTEPGELIVMAGNREAGRLAALPGLRLWLEPGPHWEGEKVRARTLFMGQEPKPVAGVLLVLDGREVGTTDADGWLTLQFGLGGYYRLEAQKDGWVAADTVVEVLPRTGFLLGNEARIGLAGPLLGAPAAAPAAAAGRTEVEDAKLLLGKGTEVRALLANPDPLPRVVRAQLYADGLPLAYQAVALDPHGSAWVAFDYLPERVGTHDVQVNDLAPAKLTVVSAISAATGQPLQVPLPGLAPLAALGLAALAGAALRRR